MNGGEMLALVERLFPICRSITGDGVRRTLEMLREEIPLEMRTVPSGTPVLDWTVPDEWNVRDAWIKDAAGERVVDFRRNCLHVMSYSDPIRRRVPLAELREHLHVGPDAIPYRTSYYHRDWGFCVTQAQYDTLDAPEYDVCIDATLAPGELVYGELFLPGREPEELIVSAHVCHPRQANDNLSGIVVATALARVLADTPRRYGVRFLFAPGTIGTIAWLAANRDRVAATRGGFTLASVGDTGPLKYKRTIGGDADIDRAAAAVLARSERGRVVDYHPYGHDERQYNSPGFRAPIGALTRGGAGGFEGYHSSADTPDRLVAGHLVETMQVALDVLSLLDRNTRYLSLAPEGEPQLGRRGLYGALGGTTGIKAREEAMLWLLALSDGETDLIETVRRSGLAVTDVLPAAAMLVEHELLGSMDDEE